MKNTVRIFALCALSVLAAQFSSAQTTVMRSEGKILFWDNDRALEGDISREGDRYRIRRELGELWLPAARVKFVCNTWKEALSFMHSRANLLDPDERLRLAHWCHLNGRHADAIREVEEALRLRPGHGRSEHFLRMVRRAVEINRRQPVSPKASPSESHPAVFDLNAESIGVFVTKVQPVLMNTCARCHAGQKNGGFHLRRIFGNGPGSRQSTRHNLAAVMKQLDLERPILSPLLIKAVSPHGLTDQPPIKSRSASPYKILKYWIEHTLENNPHLTAQKVNLTAAKSGTGESQKSNVVPAVFNSNAPMSKTPVVRPEQQSRTPANVSSGFASLRTTGQPARPQNAAPISPPQKFAKAPASSPIAQTDSSQKPPGKIFAGIRGTSRPISQANPAKSAAPKINTARIVLSPKQPLPPSDEFDANIFNWRHHPGRMAGGVNIQGSGVRGHGSGQSPPTAVGGSAVNSQ